MIPVLSRSYARRRAVAAGGGPVAGYSLWLKADAIVGLSDGDPVATWADSSGNGRDATQATSGYRATYRTGVVNSLPVVRFDGTDDYYNFSVASLGATCSVFIVQQTTGESIFLAHSVDNRQVRIRSTDQLFFTADGSSPTQSDTLATSRAAFSLIEWVWGSGTVSYYENGTARGSASATGSSMTLDTLSGALFAGVGTLPIAGDLAELLIYPSALGTTDRETVESYLATKYAL